MKSCVCRFVVVIVLVCLMPSCRRTIEKAANSAAENLVESITSPGSNTEPTNAEANIIKLEIAKYFYFPSGKTADAYTKFGNGYKMYHFQNLSFSVQERNLNQSDHKNGIQRRVVYRLTADQPFREKPKGQSWSKWKQGGGFHVGNNFNFTLITTSQGVSIEHVTPLIKNYKKPSVSDVR